MWRDRTPDTFHDSAASAHALTANAGCAHETRYTAVEMSDLGAGEVLRDRDIPDNRDSLTEEDTARAAVHKTRTGIARHLARSGFREAEAAPRRASVVLAG